MCERAFPNTTAFKCLHLVNLEKQELTHTTAIEDAAGRTGGSVFDCCFPFSIFKFVSCANSTNVAVSSSAQTLFSTLRSKCAN